MSTQKQAGHVTLHTLATSKAMVYRQLPAMLLQELRKDPCGVKESRPVHPFVTFSQAVDELQKASDDAEVPKVEGGVFAGPVAAPWCICMSHVLALARIEL